MKDKQIEFLYQSISDTQSTIRAIDVKLGFLFVVVFLPVVAIPKIHEVYQQIKIAFIYNLLSYSLLIIWGLSLFFLYKALASIRNPESVIENIHSGDNCSFYNGDLFSFKAIDVFFNFPIVAKKNINQKCSLLPQNEDEIISSLVLETVKIAYIRDLKIKRSTWCMCCTFLFVLLGTLIWGLSIFKVWL
ncbi:hypothetical protein LT068_14670 [Vibrio cholerae]|uniref:hypothetical protein n=1 Tax=Vibrio cholerae TaxID=666 RepID=UPI001E52B376|nr:hypothetical protein [Vibrio cholerae]MCD6670315.1 hypothetical protein [Vibrio cholerae]MDT8794002.1 hypothetical protein [Vibrio cholerae]MDT8827326.1 hypothetical protein [Vibrio cholerae]